MFLKPTQYHRKASVKSYVKILVLVWVLCNAVLYRMYGIETSFESIKYISQAKLLIQTGGFSSGNFLYYSVPILLIAFSIKTGLGFGFVVAVQIALNGFSVYCFYRLVKKLTSSEKLAFLYSLAFLAMAYYQVYNLYLFSESLFFSFSIIYTYILFTTEKFILRSWIIIIVLLSLLYFTRPVGIFFIPASFFYFLFRFYRRKALWVLTIIGVVFIPAFYLLVNYSLGSGGELNFLLPYQNEQVICGVSTVTFPHELTIPGDKNSIGGLWYIISHHWSLFSRLAIQRLMAFFRITRSFYSIPHNVFLCLYFYPLYILIVAGLRKMAGRHLPEFVFIMVIILLTVITVMLSCDEWHNRFLLALLPFLLLLSTAAFFNKKQGNQNSFEVSKLSL
jgi:hypothetical protein